MFARLDAVWETKEVDYLSVTLDGESKTLFERFLDVYDTPEYKTELDILQSWMATIGRNRRGAQPHYFRGEGRAAALPPQYEKRTMLRLYSLRLTQHAVVLFGGGLKTARTAQDCPIVGSHFALANRLARVIDHEIVTYRSDLLNEHDEYVGPQGGYSLEY